MPTAALPLKNLAQQLAQKQAELEEARRVYEARLADLTHRKEELQAQLHAVDAEIQAVNATPAPTTPSAPATPAAAPTPAPKATAPAPRPQVAAPPARSEGATSLTQLLVDLVRSAGRPITSSELTDAVVRAKYQTTSGNIPKLVKNKVSELVVKGVLRRAEGQSGVVLAKETGQPAPAPKAGKTAPAAKAVATGKPGGQNGKPAPKAAAPAKPAARQGTESLRDVLLRILTGAKRPLKARELGAQALATGYKTASKDSTNVVWVAVGKMDDVVENVPGEGYRLKKAAAKAK